MKSCIYVQNSPLQRADDYKLFNFDFVAHVLDHATSLEVVLKMFYGLNVVENFQVPVEVCLYVAYVKPGFH